MSNSVLRTSHEERFTDEKIPPEVYNLVQRLLRSVMTNPRSSINTSRTEAQKVILDIEVDNVRCLLIRVPVEAQKPEVVLSPREQEIARMVAKGYPNKTSAEVLDISIWTVGTHLRRIFSKLGVCSRAAMVARLLENTTEEPVELPVSVSKQQK